MKQINKQGEDGTHSQPAAEASTASNAWREEEKFSSFIKGIKLLIYGFNAFTRSTRRI